MSLLFKTYAVRDLATDAQLLGRFIRDRDDAAFTELVRRHGPLVLGVCRRVIPDRHLADDAFQAAFVVLARKAESVQPAEKLASWLYGVAHKVALRARTMAGRRAKHETLTANPPETAVRHDPIEEADGVLDAEISNLPALYRDAVVLCELQGVSRYDAAKTLGILEGTLSSRLAKARKLLAVALTRRGVTLPATLAVSTTVTLELTTATVRAATGALAPATVTTLADGVIRMMLLAKLKLSAVVGICAAMLLGLGVGSVSRPEVAIAAPVAKAEKDEGLIWLQQPKSGLLTAYTPDGKKEKELTLKDCKRFIGLTPDGQKIAFRGKNGKLAAENENDGLTLHLRDVNEETKCEDTGFSIHDEDMIVWSPDCKQVVRLRSSEENKNFVIKHMLFDLGSKKETMIEVPENHSMMRFSADGKTWQLHEYVRADLRDANLPRYRMMSVPVGGGMPTPLCDGASLLSLEPTGDGQYLGVGHTHTNPANNNEDATYRRWFRVNAKGEHTVVKTFDEFDGIEIRLAPNRQRVVCLGQTSAYDSPGDSTLLLYDLDGKNERKLLTIPHEGKQARLLGWFPKNVSMKPAAKRNAPVPKAEPDMGLLWLYDQEKGQLVAYTPDGKKVKVVTLHDDSAYPYAFHGISADGQSALFSGRDGKFPAGEWSSDLTRRGQLTLHRKPLHGDGPVTDTGIVCGFGNRFVTPSTGEGIIHGFNIALKKDPASLRPEYDISRYDKDGKNPKKLDLPATMNVRAAFPNGEYLLESVDRGKAPHFGLWRCKSGEKAVLLSGDFDMVKSELSPDGSRILTTQLGTRSTEDSATLALIDLATDEHLRIDDYKNSGSIQGFWSPDGKRVAVQWHEKNEGNLPSQKGAGEIAVCDADGTNRKFVLKLDAPGKSGSQLIGWFPARVAPKRNAPVPKAEPDVGLLWLHDTKAKKLIAKSPDGRMHKEIDLPEGDRFLGFTTDGTKILFAGKGGKVADADVTEGLTLHLRVDFVKPEGIDTSLGYQPDDQFAVSPDGKQIVRQRMEKFQNVKPKFSHVLFDVATKKETKIDLPDDHQLMQWSADGKTWRVVKNINEQWLSMPVGGGKLTPIHDSGSLIWLDPSPDGKTYLASGDQAMFHVDAANGKTTKIAAFDEVAFVVSRWSPDGQRIGCMKYDADPKNQRPCDSHLLLFDADGTNEKTLLTIKDDVQRTRFLGWFPTQASVKPVVKQNAPVPKKITDPGIVWLYNWQDGKLLAYRPNGDLLKEYKLPYGNNFHGFTPDGERFVYSDQKLPLDDRVTGRLHVRTVGDDTKATELGAEIASLFAKILWSPDGKQFVRVHGLARLKTDKDRTEVTLYDANGKEGKSWTFDDKYPTQWHPDGKSLVIAKVDDPSSPKALTLTKWDMATEKETVLFAGEHFDSPVLSPDGKSVLGFDNFAPAPSANAVGYNHGVVKYDLATKKRIDVARREKQSYAYGLWSPDGQRIAYRWLEYDFKKHKDANEGDWHFVVSDADGKNEVTIRTETKSDISPSLQVIGWYPTPAELKDAKPLLRTK